jgi:hypothetical protein
MKEETKDRNISIVQQALNIILSANVDTDDPDQRRENLDVLIVPSVYMRILLMKQLLQDADRRYYHRMTQHNDKECEGFVKELEALVARINQNMMNVEVEYQ